MPHSFKIRRIRKTTPRRIKWKKPRVATPPALKHGAIGGLLIIVVGYITLKLLSSLPFQPFFSFMGNIAGKELEIDKKGRTNILLLGIPGEGHEGKDLTDSIHLISINHQKNTASVLSIPRDLWMETKEVGANRINMLYSLAAEKFGKEESLEMMRFTMSQLFDISVHYVFLMDFKGFEKIVDAMGGIKVDVETTIDDRSYPKEGTYDYEPFFIPAGHQTLDGKTALKYARSRSTTSDFDRGKRQQHIMVALKERALSSGFLTSPSQLRALWRALSDHFETNMDLREMLTLASTTVRFDRSDISHFSLHDDPTIAGGFLYTPLRELYGGAFVLVPASDKWTEVKRYVRFITEMPELVSGGFALQVLNGSKQAGVAGGMKVILQRYGLRVPRFGNAQNQRVALTNLYIKNKNNLAAIELFKLFFPVEVIETPPEKYLLPPYQSDADMILELGEDFLPVYDKLDVFRNVVELTTTPPTAPSSTAVDSAAAGTAGSAPASATDSAAMPTTNL